VKGGAQRHGHGRCLLVRSSARPEKLVEEIAEPCLEHVHLGVGDGDALRPIVRDRPGRQVMLRRPADATRGRRPAVKIVGQNAQAEARSGYPRSSAPYGFQTNGLSLSESTLPPPGRSAMTIMAQLALRVTVSGKSSSTRSCITFGVIRPRSPRSR